MTKIDLTPEELREFARLAAQLYRLSETGLRNLRALQNRISDSPAHTLALALADAMEELEALTRERTELLCRCEPIPTLEAIGQEFIRRGFREAELEADLEAARGVIRAVTEEDGLSSDGMPRFVLVPNGSGEDLIVDHQPAVRAAWEWK